VVIISSSCSVTVCSLLTSLESVESVDSSEALSRPDRACAGSYHIGFDRVRGARVGYFYVMSSFTQFER